MANPLTGKSATPDNEIADRIKAELEARNMSILTLSEQTGIAYPTLRRSIKAGRSLRIKEIGTIADVLNVKPSALLPATLTEDAA